jgi:hypothetical protein
LKCKNYYNDEIVIIKKFSLPVKEEEFMQEKATLIQLKELSDAEKIYFPHLLESY